MPQGLLIDFEWQRDEAGYEVRAGRLWLFHDEHYPRPKTEVQRDSKLFKTDRDFFSRRIFRRGGKLIRYRPFDGEKPLCLIFAYIETPERALDFVTMYGPLIEESHPQDEGLPVALFLDHAQEMRDILLRRAKGLAPFGPLQRDRLLTSLDLKVCHDPLSNDIQMRMVPTSLLQGLQVQLAQVLSAGTLRECALCSMVFPAGPGSDRKLDAKFCTDAHRIAFNSRRRKTKE